MPEYAEIKNRAVIIDDHKGLNDVFDYILKYLPEGVYYDRNIYESLGACEECGKSYKDCRDYPNFLAQELAFDLGNVYCPITAP